MKPTIKWLLDSGDPDEYKEIAKLAKTKGEVLWGSTTNPSLIAKKLAGKKVTQKEAFALQKDLVMQIIELVPGAVSSEVYADENTSASDMIEQGREIATWHKRVVVKLPTTLEGLKARTALRKEKIMINNTLVFSQQQIFAICLHEQIMQKEFGPINDLFPPFISPFVGRLDDIGLDGMQLVEHGMQIKKLFITALPKSALAIWMLEASTRNVGHITQGIAAHTELLTAPASLYKTWFSMTPTEQGTSPKTPDTLDAIPYWNPPRELLQIDTIDGYMDALKTKKLAIMHPLTDKGLVRFAQDWKAIIN